MTALKIFSILLKPLEIVCSINFFIDPDAKHRKALFSEGLMAALSRLSIKVKFKLQSHFSCEKQNINLKSEKFYFDGYNVQFHTRLHISPYRTKFILIQPSYMQWNKTFSKSGHNQALK
jgi:hypothetical protein